jgi:uncharacterized protein YjbI with pentapeptide repeats
MTDPYSDTSLSNIQNPTTHENNVQSLNDNLELPNVQHSIFYEINSEVSDMETHVRKSHENRNSNINAELEKVQNAIIRHKTLTRKSLNFVDIRRSAISESTLNNCKVYNCVVQQCTLVKSDLHDTRVENCSVAECKMTFYPLALWRFPPELREMILQVSVTFDKRSGTAAQMSYIGKFIPS